MGDRPDRQDEHEEEEHMEAGEEHNMAVVGFPLDMGLFVEALQEGEDEGAY